MATIGITRYDLLAINAALEEIQNVPGPVPFTLTVARLLALFGPAVEAIRDRGRLSPDLTRRFQNYESARLLLARAHAQTDAKGNVLLDAMGTFILKDAVAFEEALLQLQRSDQHRDAFDAVERAKTEWRAWADGNADIPDLASAADLPRLQSATLPGTLTARQLQPLLPLLDV